MIREHWPEMNALLMRADRQGQFYRMSGSGSTVFRITGIGIKSIKSEDDFAPLEIPEGTERVFTRTAWSVVPVELLD